MSNDTVEVTRQEWNAFLKRLLHGDDEHRRWLIDEFEDEWERLQGMAIDKSPKAVSVAIKKLKVQAGHSPIEPCSQCGMELVDFDFDVTTDSGSHPGTPNGSTIHWAEGTIKCPKCDTLNEFTRSN